jgi:hypothetical protein
MRKRTTVHTWVLVFTLFVFWVCGAVIGFSVGAHWVLAQAHADVYGNGGVDSSIDQPDLNGIICTQLALGESPGEIAERLHQGDGRLSIWQTGQAVRDALPGCG